MSCLTSRDMRVLEDLLRIGSGFVLDFSDQTFGDFVHEAVGIDIHSKKYMANGSSKAKKLRALWQIEPDHIVGKLLTALVDYAEDSDHVTTEEDKKKSDLCREIVSRLLSGGPSLDDLKQKAQTLNANHLAEQIRRMKDSVEADPSLAIGTAKELIETCCKTILAERGQEISGTPDIPTLTKATFKQLNLVPEGIPNSARGAEVIKRILSNLSTAGHGLAELRGLYGTGHGQHAATSGLTSRHAKLAVSAASTLAIFHFETHEQAS
ncbi:MAG: abortive infection family protein [Synechococcaceae cyanobacterium]|jgi:hypothetical protein